MIDKLIHHRWTIWFFALRQLQDRYAGTWGGLLWAVLQPLMLLLVFWVVFEKGMRMSSGGGKPFVLVLFCGLVPWMLVQECLSGAATSISGRGFLVKKIAFPSEILPFTHVVAALLTHGVLLVILFAMFAWHRHLPGIGPLLVLLPYYLACLVVMVSGMSIFLSAVNVFYRDVGQILGVALNIWFWLTPIVWPLTLVPPKYHWVLDVNPLAYIIQGYRDALLEHSIRLPALAPSLWFWAFALGLLVFAYRLFLKLKPSFPDFL